MSSLNAAAIEHKIVVGIADLVVSNDPNVTLTTYSLGSCLGLAIYDPAVKVGGLLHLMLPDSSLDPAKAMEHPAMFVDTGVPALFRAAYPLGADKHRMIIGVAGGATILDSGCLFNMGERNVEALERLFKQHNLHIHSCDVGGTTNRTMQLNLGTGEVRLKISGRPDHTTILCKNSTTT